MNKTPTLIIDANQPHQHYWKNLWQYRELFFFLAWRDITVRYKQTWLGITWVLAKPLVTMIVFTFVFHKLANLSTGETPYPAMVLSGMIAWQLFASVLGDSSVSIVNNANMISKIYFPRLIIPISTSMVGLVDFLITFIMLLALLLCYGLMPAWHIIVLPAFVMLTLMLAIGIGLWSAALNVKYRDFRFIIGFGIQLGLYISPVGYSINIIPQQWQFAYSLNPIVGIIEGFRWALLPTYSSPYWVSVWISACAALLFFSSGIWYFKKMEQNFADEI